MIYKKVGEMEAMGFFIEHFERQDCKELSIGFSIDQTQHGKLKHMSIAHPHRHPTWEEILHAKERFFGDIDCAMVMPKKEDYVNLHKHCFHVWEMPVAWGVR